MTTQTPSGSRDARLWRVGGIWLGIGLGGFFDGIVLHQILQWHHLLSEHYHPTTLQNLQINTLADGFFHAFTWVATVIGLFCVWNGTRGQHPAWSTRVFLGTLLLGWGGFNLAEGLINHQILGIHHVRPGPHGLAYDIGFLVWGLLMMVWGWVWMRREKV